MRQVATPWRATVWHSGSQDSTEVTLSAHRLPEHWGIG